MTREGCLNFTLSEQMSNIGAEVHHFVETRRKYKSGESAEDYSDFYYNKAISYIDIIEEDPKNARRISELEDCKRELLYLKEGIYAEDYVLSCWDQYTVPCAFWKQRNAAP